MKKYLVMLFILFVIFVAFTACTDPDEQGGEENNNSQTDNPEGENNQGGDGNNANQGGDTESEHVHSYEWVYDLEPTYSSSGIMHKECTCGERTDENTVADILLHEEILSEGMKDLSGYTQTQYNSTYALGAFIRENGEKLGGKCLTIGPIGMDYERMAFNHTKYHVLGYKEEVDGRYVDPFMITYYELVVQRVDGVDIKTPDPFELSLCFVTYGTYDETQEYSYDFYKYECEGEKWEYLIRVSHNGNCVGEIFYYALIPLSREWILTFVSDYISLYTQDVDIETREELHSVFDKIREDGLTNEKIVFSDRNIWDEDLHYELKASGKYDESPWKDSSFGVTIICDYGLATDEEWYKQNAESDSHTLNLAFYDYYKESLSNGSCTSMGVTNGIHLVYYSIDDFMTAYPTLIALTEQGYVLKVGFSYIFGLPHQFYYE